ncbi:MAG: beta-ketoacyl-ACP synthase [Rubrivivax sp.]|nr:beta-ketoacyl-ACP synthase [Rubrivivax sp.]
MKLPPLPVAAHTLVTALGAGRDTHAAALRAGRSGLTQAPFETCTLSTWLGIVDGLDTVRMPAGLESWDCRNHRLAERALRSDGFDGAVAAAVRRHGADRIGVLVGTSTSGILSTEIAYRERDPASGALPAWLDYQRAQDTAAVAGYVRAALGLAGPSYVVSTACSSSAKAYASAARLITLGVIDAAVVGGVDSLCLTTLYGFNSLELLSPAPCRPWDAARNGLSLGEGAAFALIERDAAAPMAWLLGSGESSDGHHMSSPHPQGAGAALAMRAALAAAGIAAGDVDYLNLHGTGTPSNDAAEDLAVCEVFGTALPCSSTKGATGHALGAAGGVEASIAMLALEHGCMPAGLHVTEPDPALHAAYLREPRVRPLRVVASNAFGFGGTNVCLLFGHADHTPGAGR